MNSNINEILNTNTKLKDKRNKSKKKLIINQQIEDNEINKIIEDLNFKIKKDQTIIDKIISNINSIKICCDNLNKPKAYQVIFITCSNEKCKKTYPEKYFVSDTNGSLTKQCQFCRDKGKKKDHKESRKIKKKIWKDLNHDKVAKYTLDYRGRKMIELGKKYWDIKADQAKNWRDNNPEKVKEGNEKKKQNINYHYKTYINVAKNKNLNFEISLEEFIELIKNPCFYCGIIQDKGFNGIDKKVCSDGYILENVVSCCEMCNFMKGTLTPDVFYKKIEHILTYHEIIQGELCPEYFVNHKSTNYKTYKNRAINDLNIDFKITKKEFNEIINKECYLCGKKSNNKHKNGIDRIDNNLGYIKNNIKSCCGDCNYMKNKYDLNILIDKMKLIHENLKNYEFDENEIKIFEHKKKHLNKISQEERIKQFEEKIKKQKQDMIEKYNSDEFKKNKAFELSLLRK